MSYPSVFQPLNTSMEPGRGIGPQEQATDSKMLVDGDVIIIRNSYIVASSIDRNWESSEGNPYRFTVKLGGTGDSWQSYPLYQNSPTVPASSAQAASGQRGSPNISGWFNSVGQFYGPYDPSQPFGQVVDNERIYYKGSQYLVVNSEPKNIISIGVSKLMLSSRNLRIGYSTNLVSSENNAMILVLVDNIDYATYGTNKLIDNSLGLMTPYLPIPTSLANNFFVEYKNLLGNAKEYYQNPLASISRLSINITTPLGGPFDPELVDVLDVFSIYYMIGTPGDASTEFLVIQTKQYFSASGFQTGDSLQFRNYVYRDTGVYSEAGIFNEFINRETGHLICGVGKSDPSTFYNNIIYICAPSNINQSTGQVANIAWYSSLKMKSMGMIPIADVSGRFINVSVQTTVMFNIKYLEKSGKFMNDLI